MPHLEVLVHLTKSTLTRGQSKRMAEMTMNRLERKIASRYDRCI